MRTQHEFATPAGCAPSTPERACFLAPASKPGRPLRAGARGLPGGPGPGFAVRCSARYGVSGPQPATRWQTYENRKERKCARQTVVAEGIRGYLLATILGVGD